MSTLSFLAILPAALAVTGLLIYRFLGSQKESSRITSQIVEKLRADMPERGSELASLPTREVSLELKRDHQLRRIVGVKTFELLQLVLQQEHKQSLVVYGICAGLFLVGMGAFMYVQTRPPPPPNPATISPSNGPPSTSGTGGITNPAPVVPPGPAQRIETLAVRWVVAPVPDAVLETLFEAEVNVRDYWQGDDNLKFISDAPRQMILEEQNRGIARLLMKQLGAGKGESKLGTTLAILELNEAGSLTLPFGSIHLDEEVWPRGEGSLKRSDVITASSGIGLLYPESRAPYDDDPERDEALKIIRQRTRKNEPRFQYKRTGLQAQLSIRAYALAFADWIDKLSTTGEFSTPLPAEFRIVLLTEVQSLPIHPNLFCDVMSVLQRDLTSTIEARSSADSATIDSRPLTTTWLALKPNDDNEVFYRVEWQRDETFTTKGGPEVDRVPVCRVSLFRARRVNPETFQQATGQPNPAADVKPGGVLILASDPMVAPHSNRIKALIGNKPLVELPLGTGLDEALAWCGKAQPSAIIISPKAFGPGKTLYSRAFIRAALSGSIQASVLRVLDTEDSETIPPEILVSGFENEVFGRLQNSAMRGKKTEEQWELIKAFLTGILSQ